MGRKHARQRALRFNGGLMTELFKKTDFMSMEDRKKAAVKPLYFTHVQVLICRYRLSGERGKSISVKMNFTADNMTEYTRYEKARIIGARALQISRGAPVMIKTDTNDPIEIAEQEFEQNVIPIDVRMRT